MRSTSLSILCSTIQMTIISLQGFRGASFLGSRNYVRRRLQPVTKGGARAFGETTALCDSWSLSEPTLWTIRGTSAVVSYLGLVAYLDRPRGALMEHVNDQLQVRASSVPGAGLGLFVTQHLSKGTKLGTYPGVVMPLNTGLPKVNQFPHCEAYIWRFSDSKYIIDPTDPQGYIQDECRGGNPSLPGSTWLCQNIFAFGVPTTLCRINEPPIGKDTNVITEEHLPDRTVTFLLERDVDAGEELFIDYGITYDRSRYGAKS